MFSVFKDSGVDLSKPVITHCNSGMSSCTLALAAEVAGCPTVSVFHVSYDFVALRPTVNI